MLSTNGFIFPIILSTALQSALVAAKGLPTLSGGHGGDGAECAPGLIGANGGLGEGPIIHVDETFPIPFFSVIAGGVGGSGGDGNPPGRGGIGGDAKGALIYGQQIVGGLDGVKGLLKTNFGQGGRGGDGEGPTVIFDSKGGTLRARSNSSIPLRPGASFKSGNGDNAGKAGKSIGEWKGGQGGKGGNGGAAYLVWDSTTQQFLGVDGEDGEHGQDGEDAQVGKHGADGADGKHGRSWGKV